MKDKRPLTPELQFDLELEPNWEELRKEIANALDEYKQELQQEYKENHIFRVKQSIKEENEVRR
jgi:hypothetical protein